MPSRNMTFSKINSDINNIREWHVSWWHLVVKSFLDCLIWFKCIVIPLENDDEIEKIPKNASKNKQKTYPYGIGTDFK